MQPYCFLDLSFFDLETTCLEVFSTATAFYIPLIAIICIYWKIMRAAKKRFKRERDRRTIIRQPEEQQNEKSAPLILKKNKKGVTADSSTSTQSEEGNANHNIPEQETKLDDMVQKGRYSKIKKRRKENAETKRERKAWRTLAIITATSMHAPAPRHLAILRRGCGAVVQSIANNKLILGTFVACWTPFFLVSLYRPICGCTIPRLLETVTSWLGYLNSALNPIIYTVFSQDM
ncbi:unnamed protein product, partial [Cylicostephanus goldi]